MLVYFICLIVLGIPAMVMEFSVGRAAQTSPVRMYRRLEKPGQKWHLWGAVCLIGNIAIMAFYCVVTGWIIYYFLKFLTGQNASFGFASMIANPVINVVFLFVTVAVAFLILSRDIQKGLERITKYMMSALLVLMLVRAARRRGGRTCLLPYAGLFQDQRFGYRRRDESGVLHPVHRHGRHGDFRQLHRQGPLADG